MNPATAKSTFAVTTPSDREISMTRVFNAPRRLVFAALTQPELVKQWLLGPPGWTMPICDIDLKVGGKYRYVWKRDSDGTEMSNGGVFREIVPPDRIVVTERFEQPWYPGEGLVTSALLEVTIASLKSLQNSLVPEQNIKDRGQRKVQPPPPRWQFAGAGFAPGSVAFLLIVRYGV